MEGDKEAKKRRKVEAIGLMLKWLYLQTLIGFKLGDGVAKIFFGGLDGFVTGLERTLAVLCYPGVGLSREVLVLTLITSIVYRFSGTLFKIPWSRSKRSLSRVSGYSTLWPKIIATYGWSLIALNSAAWVSPRNGKCPVTMWNSVTPAAQISICLPL